MLVEKNKKNIRFFFLTFVLSVMIYSVLIANELTNTYDGMWEGAHYIAHGLLIRTGRWFWPLIGLARKDISPEPFTSLASIALFSAGSCLITDLFKITSQGTALIVALNLLVNTTVCAFLSYRFMSPTFAAAFFLCVLAIWSLREIKDRKLSLLMTSLFLVLSLACYQADLGCFCLMVLMFTIKDILEKEELKKAGGFLLKAGLCTVASCCLYKMFWDLGMHIFRLEPISYKGADNLSVGRMLKCFPAQLLKTYQSFFSYFTDNHLKHHIFQNTSFYTGVLILFLVGVLMTAWAKAAEPFKSRICLTFILLLLIPPAANVTMLIAVDSGEQMIQMTMPLVMVFPCLLALLDGSASKEACVIAHHQESFSAAFACWMKRVCSWIMVFILYGSFLMVSIDQHEMLVSRQTTLSFMNRVISGIELSSDTYPMDGLVFIGRPSDNPLYLKDEVWNYSNQYARYGEFWMTSDCGPQSYKGLLRDCGFNISVNPDAGLWHQLEASPEILEMPVYPEKGYIKKTGSCMVVKISEPDK